MDNSNNLVDNQFLVNIPLAFILEEKTVQEIEQSFDGNGWNLMHYAIAEKDLPKIRELIHYDFNWNVNSKKNHIPLNIYDVNGKKKPQKCKLLDKIPFCKNGFSPIHLALFLFHHYNQLNEEFYYHTVADEYMNIISLIIGDATETELGAYIDADGYSLFDYAFLLEDLALIEKLQMFDMGFTSLRKVSAELGKKILNMMVVKYQSKSNEELLNSLEKKILNDSLNSNLKSKQSTQKAIQKI